jgi:alkylated DNA repair dioxygenase AlkB
MSEDGTARAFWDDGYLIIPDLISAEQCQLLQQSMDVSRQAGRMRVDDNEAYRGPNNEYAPLLGQVLLGNLAPKLSAMVGQTLLPSFAFWRIYEEGAMLNPHKDRNSCEVSVTIAVASKPEDRIWPIGVTDLHGEDHSIALVPGSGLLYQGTEVQHWREPLIGDRQYQMFLHYVVEGEPNAALANDKGRTKIPFTPQKS